MKSVSSGTTRGSHPHHRRKKKSKKKKYIKFPKRLKKQRKTVSEQSQDELEPITSTPINSPMSDEWLFKGRFVAHRAQITPVSVSKNLWYNLNIMNVFIILSILIIVIGVLLIVATPSVLFKFNWNEKTGLEKILVILFYCILLYIINIIYWFINWM